MPNVGSSHAHELVISNWLTIKQYEYQSKAEALLLIRPKQNF